MANPIRKPVVALVGRPNVGKSALFNRLAGRTISIVHDQPGVTRDRVSAPCSLTAVPCDLVDTGGIGSLDNIDFSEAVSTEAQIAMDTAEVILFIVDAREGLTPVDQAIAQQLRKAAAHVCLVLNKADHEELDHVAGDFAPLGLGGGLPVSAAHGRNFKALLTELDERLQPFAESSREAEEAARVTGLKIAVIGKPNAGKSSLLNRLVGEERAIVSPIAGTTRDAVDTKLTYEDIPLTLIDTAGIRRRGKIDPGVERYSVVRAHKAIERADVALLMIDAEAGITAQDLHIAGYILDAWKSVVVLVNKWDAIEKDTYTMNYYTERILYELNFMPYVPLVFISAKTGQRVDKVLPTALEVQEARLQRIPTAQLNRVLREALDAHPAPSQAGKQLKIYYATQVRSDPPTFLIYVNDPKLMHFTYRRFLENRIRKAFPFPGTPIRTVLKGKKETKKKK